MKIEFIPDIGENGEIIEKMLKSLFEGLVPNNSLDKISKYIITEDSYYKSVVKAIDTDSEVSDNYSVVGVAKTIFDPIGKKSTIVIKNHQIIPLIEGLNSELKIEDWPIEQQNPLYTSLHEIAHSIDYNLRPYTKLEKLKVPIKFIKVWENYHLIILDEIGANINIKELMPLKLKIKLREIFIHQIKTALFELEGFCKFYRGRILNINQCFELISLLSVMILRIQERFIHRSEKNEDLGFFSKEIQSLVKIWIEELEYTYPDCDSSSNRFNELIQVFFNEFNIKSLQVNNEERFKMNF